MHDGTWNQGLSGHVTCLRTGQSLSRGLELTAEDWSLKAKDWNLSALVWSFVSIGHKSVMGCNT